MSQTLRIEPKLWWLGVLWLIGTTVPLGYQIHSDLVNDKYRTDGVRCIVEQLSEHRANTRVAEQKEADAHNYTIKESTEPAEVSPILRGSCQGFIDGDDK